MANQQFTSNSSNLNDLRAYDELRDNLSNSGANIMITRLEVLQDIYSFSIATLNFEDRIIIEYIGKSNDEIIEEFVEKVNLWRLMGLENNIFNIKMNFNSTIINSYSTCLKNSPWK